MDSPRKPTVKTEKLTTGYRGKKSQHIVSTDLDEVLLGGELTCLLGPNGAGKSTVLKTLSGFLPPLKGKVMIEGRDIREYKGAELAKVIGVVLTERPVLSNMSVRELVALGRSPYTGFWGSLSAGDRRIVEESMAATGIELLADRNVATLSDGERQKAMIAKVLAQETPVIFLDEPTAFLDYPSKVEIMLLLRTLARDNGKTVFLSTHDLEIALQIADRAWLMDRRLGIRTGSPDRLSSEGEIGKYFNRKGLRYDAARKGFLVETA